MNILIIDAFPSNFIDQLSQMPVTYTFIPEADRAEVLEKIPEAEILILNSKIRVTKEVVDMAPKLKMVIRAGVGMDHIDVEYLESKGIIVLNTKGGNADSVGEQTIGTLLALQHKIVRANSMVKQFIWERPSNRGIEIGGKTMGIIGYGNTGQALARKLDGFDMEVIAYDKYREDYEDDHAEQVSMEQIFKRSDFVSLHVPLTEETHHLVNRKFIDSFSKPFVLLNLSRGPVVELPALLEGLESRKILAAGIDVLENEKFDQLTEVQRENYAKLFSYENVIVTPHVGGWSYESLENINNMILAFVSALIED